MFASPSPESKDSLFNVISLSEVYSNDNAVAVIIQHNQTQKCLFLDDQGTVGMMVSRQKLIFIFTQYEIQLQVDIINNVLIRKYTYTSHAV